MSLMFSLMSYLEEALATSSPAKFFIIYSVSSPLCIDGGGTERHGGGIGWSGGGTGKGLLACPPAEMLVLLANAWPNLI